MSPSNEYELMAEDIVRRNGTKAAVAAIRQVRPIPTGLLESVADECYTVDDAREAWDGGAIRIIEQSVKASPFETVEALERETLDSDLASIVLWGLGNGVPILKESRDVEKMSDFVLRLARIAIECPIAARHAARCLLTINMGKSEPLAPLFALYPTGSLIWQAVQDKNR